MRSTGTTHRPGTTRSDTFLPHVPVDQFDQLIVRFLGFVLSGPNCGGRAVPQMVSHQLATDTTKRFVCGGDLSKDVRAVAIFFDHLLQAPHLPFYPAEPLEVALFDVRIDADGFAVGLHAAAARGTVAARSRKAGRSILPFMLSPNVLDLLFPVLAFHPCLRGLNVLRRKLFVTTLTELSAIAPLARIGLRSTPAVG